MFIRFCDKILGRKTQSQNNERTDLDTNGLSSYLSSLPRRNRIQIYIYGKEKTGRTSFACHVTRGYYSTEFDPLEDGLYAKNTYVDGCFFPVIFEPTHLLSRPPPSTTSRSQELSFYILSYSVKDRETFDGLDELYDQVLAVRDRTGQVLNWKGGFVVALSCDLPADPPADPGVVSRNDGQRFAEDHNLPFHEASGKTGYGCTIDDFEKILRNFLSQAATQWSNEKKGNTGFKKNKA